jgi:hypothetical protein
MIASTLVAAVQAAAAWARDVLAWPGGAATAAATSPAMTMPFVACLERPIGRP